MNKVIDTEQVIESKQILKDLHQVLVDAKKRFTDEFIAQEVKLSDTFKVTFRNMLNKKNCTVEYFSYTTVVNNTFGQQIYIANQWFVIASYFVDFCSEMLSYQSLFFKICERIGLNHKGMKEYATRLKEAPTMEDKSSFMATALEMLNDDYSDVHDDKHKVATYLWKFVSDYSWWAGNKTVDRNDFYFSALLNQMNVVNASAGYLATIAWYYSCVLSLRLLVDNTDNFTIDLKKKTITVKPYKTEPQTDTKLSESNEIYKANKGISISAASLERFQSMS